MKPKRKYYLWDFSKSYGWRPLGRLEGYDSKEELKKDDFEFKFNLKIKRPTIILKAIIDEEYNLCSESSGVGVSNVDSTSSQDSISEAEKQ